MSSADRIALFDMDGSLADFNGAMRRDLEALRSPGEEPIGDDFYRLEELPHMKRRMQIIKAQPGWWLELEPIEMGMRILRLAQEIGYRCDILTKGPSSHPTAWKEKVEWCRRHLGDIDVHIVTNKSLVYGTMLYDDFHGFMSGWLSTRPRGLGIMPSDSGPRVLDHPNLIYWDGQNFDQVREAMIRAYEREPAQELVLNESH
jgi:5'-nucleotidase